MKQKLLLLLVALLPMVANAYDAEIDGIYYNFSGNEATVTYKEYKNQTYVSDYSGSEIIPNSVSFNGQTYSVTSIGNYAFYYCRSLTSVTIPNSVTSIGVGAFTGCSSLTSVHITDLAAWCGISFAGPNPLYYAHHLFVNGEEITDLVIPDGVTSIGDKAFSECSSLTSVTIPNSVTSIGSYAFEGCI